MHNIFIQSELFKKTRYFLSVLLVLFFFLLSNNFFYYKTLSWKKCGGGKCQILDNDLRGIFGERESVFFQSPLVLEKEKFYRLVFEAKSDEVDQILVELSDDLVKNDQIGKVQIEKSTDFSYYEIKFQSRGEYDKLIFRRDGFGGKDRIYFRNIVVFPLSLKNQLELSGLENTIVNKPDFSLVNQEQIADLNSVFLHLKGGRAVLGQLFQSQEDSISGVRFFVDISDNDSDSTRQFTLELREAIGENNKFKLKKELMADLGFSLEALKKYRQTDGSFLFPIFAKLEKGKYYFISINNGKIDDNRKDYLIPHGSEQDLYLAGFAALRKGSELLPLSGDLGFAVYGMNLSDKQLLPGLISQDLGGGKRSLFLKMPEDASALLALKDKTLDVGFDDGRKVLFGTASNQSEFKYELLTPTSVAKIKIIAEQADEDWSKIKLFYSADGSDWQALESSIEDNTQVFKGEFKGVAKQKKILIKITYDGNDDSERYYGVKNFSISAELNPR